MCYLDIFAFTAELQLEASVFALIVVSCEDNILSLVWVDQKALLHSTLLRILSVIFSVTLGIGLMKITICAFHYSEKKKNSSYWS